MIRFEDKKYGKVIIYDQTDVLERSGVLTVDLLKLYFEELKERNLTSIIGFRNLEKGIVKLLKNRFGSIKDYKIEQFILNYREKNYTKFTRFEIMEI